MDVLGGVGNAFSVVTGYGLPFLFVLMVVVFIHELGHFQVARWCGVAVRAFSIGFGPELAGWTDRRGTRWRIAAIPLGGYVKFEDDDNAASVPDREALGRMTEAERARSFQAQPVWKRTLIVLAGPVANFILAIAIFTAVYALEGRNSLLAYVGSVAQDSAAAGAGLKPGDRIVAIDGDEVTYFSDLIRKVAGSAGESLKVTVEREGSRFDVTLVPKMVAEETKLGVQRRGMLGVGGDPTKQIKQSFTIPEALREGIKQNWVIAEQTVKLFGRLLTGRENIDQLSGIGRIAQASGESAKLGFVSLVLWLGYISTSIGLLNLMPIPVLDGGHLVFYAVEALRGRPLSERAQDIGFRIGFALVLMLIVVANWNDVVHFASKWG